MKSKGLLYLTAYVSMYAEKGKLRSPRHRAEKGSVLRTNQKFALGSDAPPHDNALASLANTCSGKDGGWSPSDLYAKLHKFENDHPRLFAKLQAKLNELHEFPAGNTQRGDHTPSVLVPPLQITPFPRRQSRIGGPLFGSYQSPSKSIFVPFFAQVIRPIFQTMMNAGWTCGLITKAF